MKRWLPVLCVLTLFLMAASSYDRRRDKRPVWTRTLTQLSWASGETAAQTVAIPINGIVRGFTTTVSNATNAITFTVAFADENSVVMASTAAIAENASTYTEDNAWMDHASKVIVTPSGDSGASGVTVDILLRGE